MLPQTELSSTMFAPCTVAFAMVFHVDHPGQESFNYKAPKIIKPKYDPDHTHGCLMSIRYGTAFLRRVAVSIALYCGLTISCSTLRCTHDPSTTPHPISPTSPSSHLQLRLRLQLHLHLHLQHPPGFVTLQV